MATALHFILWLLHHYSTAMILQLIFFYTADGFGEITCLNIVKMPLNELHLLIVILCTYYHGTRILTVKNIVDWVNVFEANSLILHKICDNTPKFKIVKYSRKNVILFAENKTCKICRKYCYNTWWFNI